MTTDRTAWMTADASEFPQLPYPGIRPAGSWRLTMTGRLHRLDQLSERSVRDRITGEIISLTGRLLILAYGSNASPRKLRSKYPARRCSRCRPRSRNGRRVWCSQRRRSAEAVCTLERAPGTREAHVVLAVTPAQPHQMDTWEGHPRYYERHRLPCGRHARLRGKTTRNPGVPGNSEHRGRRCSSAACRFAAARPLTTRPIAWWAGEHVAAAVRLRHAPARPAALGPATATHRRGGAAARRCARAAVSHPVWLARSGLRPELGGCSARPSCRPPKPRPCVPRPRRHRRHRNWAVRAAPHPDQRRPVLGLPLARTYRYLRADQIVG
jgi:hypothetical protein